MATPGVIRLLTDLSDGTIEELSPLVDDDSGQVSYPLAEKHIERREQPVPDLLERLSNRGILDQTFERKCYICPSCNHTGLRYTSICPYCRSENAVGSTRFVHRTCEYRGTEQSFSIETDGEEDEYECPSCNVSLSSLDVLKRWEGHVCYDCQREVDQPNPGLHCSTCDGTYYPSETVEWPLYSYTLSNEGERWLTLQLDARRAIANQLANREMNVEIDVPLDETADSSPTVHVFATDEFFDERIVADIEDRPTVDDVKRLQEMASNAITRLIIVTVSGEVTEQAADLADESGIRFFSYDGDTTLVPTYDIIQSSGKAPVFERLTTGVRKRLS